MSPPRQFIDPLGSRLPALEANVLRLRATQMLLVLFHAEELKREILDLIQTSDRFRNRLGTRSGERVPKGVKNPVGKALDALVADKAISRAEKEEIERLIDYRNAVGHQLHTLLADVGTKGTIREMASGIAELRKVPAYRPDAAVRLRQFRDRLNALSRSHHYVRSISFNGLMFEAAERVLLADIQRLEAKVGRLAGARVAEVKRLNAELSLKGTGLEDEWHPAGPWSKYSNGRLSPIGVEICYRLFDQGRTPLAVAHLARLSLVAAKARKKAWTAAGGRGRHPVDLSSLARPRLRRLDD